MPQSKILLDTNAYLRLAHNLHPLLFQEFGKKKYTLYVIDDFQKEFDRSLRLKNKFYWVNKPEFKENRKKRIKMSRQNKKDIAVAQSIIWEQNITMGFGSSKIDIRALAFGYVLNIPVVKDDTDMVNLGKVLGIEIWGILTLMKLMYDNIHVGIQELKALADYMDYNNDLPYFGFKKEFKKVFGK